MATVVKTLRASGGDYSLLSTWDSTESTNSANDGNPHELQCRSITLTDDPTTMSSWTYTRSATNNITIKVDAGFEDTVSIETRTRYGVVLTTASNHYVHIDGINFKRTNQRGEVVRFGDSGTAAAPGNSIKNSKITSTVDTQGIVLVLNRSIAENVFIEAEGTDGIYMGNSDGGIIRNCTIHITGAYGVRTGTGSGTDAPEAVNTVVVGSTTASFSTSGTWSTGTDYNAGNDTSAPGTNAVDNISTTDGVDFVAPSTDDYTPEVGGALDGAGSSPAVLSTDIDGNTRNDPDDIGAWAIPTVTHTGSGTPSAQDADASGTGEREITGSGTPASQAATASGTGTIASLTVEAGGPYSGVNDTAIQLYGSYVADETTLLMKATLQDTLVLDVGSGDPTFTRASTATFTDFEGIIREVPSGCARFQGARMVHNLVDTSSVDSANLITTGSATVADNGDGSARLTLGAGDGVYFRSRSTETFDEYEKVVASCEMKYVSGSTTELRLDEPSGWTHHGYGANLQAVDNPSQYTSFTQFSISTEFTATAADDRPGMWWRNTGTGSIVIDIRNYQVERVNGLGGFTSYLYGEFNKIIDAESSDFTGGSWTRTRISVTEPLLLPPLGQLAADKAGYVQKLVESTDNNTHVLVRSMTSSANLHTLSVYAKASGRDWIALVEPEDGVGRYFDLANGVEGGVHTAAPSDSGIEPLGDGWYRCWIQATPPSTTIGLEVYVASADGTTSYAGDGASGVYLWGARVEEWSKINSYLIEQHDPSEHVSLGRITTYNNIVDGTWRNTGTGVATVTAGNGTSATVDCTVLGTTATNSVYIRTIGSYPMDGSDYTASIKIKAKEAADVGKTIDVLLKRNSGGTLVSDTTTHTLTADYGRVEVGPITGVTDNLEPVIYIYQGSSGTAATQCTVTEAQIEDVTGQAVQTAGDYYAIGGTTTPHHGAAVDGVKFFSTDRDGNALNDSHYGCDGDGPLGFISETADTNDFTYSEAFTGWTLGDVTTTERWGSPFGAEYLFFEEDETTTFHSVSRTLTRTISQQRTVSIFAKAAGRDHLIIWTYASGGANQGASFDLANGTATTFSNAPDDYDIEPVGNGWYRCWLTYTPTTTSVGYNFYVSTDGSTQSYAGVAGKGLALWGAHDTVGGVLPTYTASDASFGTRSADYLYYQFADHIGDTAGTGSAYISCFWEATPASNNYVFGPNNALLYFPTSGTNLNGSDGTNYASVSFSNPREGWASVAWGDNLTLTGKGTDGTPLSYDGDLSSAQPLGIGARLGGEQLDGTIRNVEFHSTEGTMPITLLWSVETGTGTFSDTGDLNPTFTPTGGPGAYVVRLTVTSWSGKSANDDANLTAIVSGAGDATSQAATASGTGTVSSATTTITKTLKQSGGDYSLPATWNSTEATNLVTDNELHVLECYDTWTGGLSGQFQITGWTTDADHYITVKCPSGEGHGGVIDGGFYFEHNVSNTYCIDCHADYTRFEDIQVKMVQRDGGNMPKALQLNCTNVTLDRCILYADGSGSHNGALRIYEGPVTATACLFVGTGWTNSFCIYSTGNTTENKFYNCTFISKDNTSTQGVHGGYYSNISLGNDDYVTIDATAGYISGTSEDYFAYSNFENNNGGYSGDYNVDNTGNNVAGANSIHTLTTANEFTDFDNEDFSIKDTDSLLYDGGPSVPSFTDIAGNAYVTKDVGAYAFIAADVTGSGAPASQSATASGTGEREVTGTGTPTSQDATAAGVGEREITGAGTPTSQDATADGTGTAYTVITGSGTPTSQAATASGVGEREVTGAGTPTSQAATASGVGEVEITGSGTPTSQAATASGVGEREITGAGTPTSQAATASGIGEREITASGTPTSQAATASGLGTVGAAIIGSGAAVSQDATASGVGEREITGAGTPTAQAATAAGVGEREITGAGTPTAEDATASGTGEVSGVVTGSGTPAAQNATASGIGEREIPGTGTPTAQPATVSGTGEVSGAITGTGTPAAQDATASGTGVREITGSGTPTSQAATVSGVAERTVTGTGAATSEDATASGVGTAGNVVTGSGTPAAQNAAATGIGLRVITGSGTPQAQSATAFGTGSVVSEVTGTGDAESGPATATGVALRVITGSGACVAQSASCVGYDIFPEAQTTCGVTREIRVFSVIEEGRTHSVTRECRVFGVEKTGC